MLKCFLLLIYFFNYQKKTLMVSELFEDKTLCPKIVSLIEFKPLG